MRKEERPGSSVFFTSDLHFGHGGIIQFAGRPFSSSEEMDRTLVKNWNAVVPCDAVVYVLGDIGFSSADEIVKLFGMLNGTKILIRGNHDTNYKESVLAGIFDEIQDVMYLRVYDDRRLKYEYMVLCHYPMLDWQSSFRGAWQLFGHLHTRSIPEFATVRTHLFNTQYDVGVDNNGFAPVSFHQIRKIMDDQSFDSAFRQTIYY